ncbi:MAG: PIN domain-containing protein, partial [Nitrososphaeraceae archaeon]
GQYENHSSSNSDKIETFNAYESWMNSALKGLGSTVYVAPDTNFIKRQLFSNFWTTNMEYPFVIPRLVILEIENQYNINKEKVTPKNKNNKNKNEAEQKVRESFLDMTEVLKIQRNGGKVIPLVDTDLLQTFSTAKKLSDSWIRMEVKKFDTDLRSWRESKKRCIFLSCDLMNSLAANAEGLDTIYFYTTDNVRYDLNLMSSLLVNTAITYEKCSVYGKDDRKICDLVGVWHGKNPLDWQNEINLISTEI